MDPVPPVPTVLSPEMVQMPVPAKKNRLPIVILIFFLVLLFVVIFVPIPYYQSEEFPCKLGQINCPRIGWHWNKPLYQSFQGFLQTSPRSQVTRIDTPNSTDTPSYTADPTANWKTYTHSILGYSFSYPESVSVEVYNNSTLVRIDPPDPRMIVGICPRWISFSAVDSSSNAKKTQDEYKCVNDASILKEKILVKSQYRESSQKIIDQILSTFRFLDSSPKSDYTCPQTEYIDCMPIVSPDRRSMCDQPYLTWVHQNCPNFKGVAY